MAQLTLYLDEETARSMSDAAKAAGISKSLWVAQLIRERLDAAWPQPVVELAGAWSDVPDAEELRKGFGCDAPREVL